MILRYRMHAAPVVRPDEEVLLPLDERYDYDTLLGDLPKKLGLESEHGTPLRFAHEDPDLGESSELSDVSFDPHELRIASHLKRGGVEIFPFVSSSSEELLPPDFEEVRASVLEDVRELRIGGGGARGYALPGFLRALVEYGGLDLTQIRIFNGISVGSSLAAFLAIGMNIEELSKITFRLDGEKIKGMTRRSIFGLVANFLDSIAYRMKSSGKWIIRALGGLVKGISSFIRWLGKVKASLFHSSWGVCESDGMRATLEHAFERKVGIKSPTFRELQEKGIDLRVITTIICCRGRREWSAHTDPDQEVIPVLIASMSIPGAFQPFRDAQGHIHADGGVPNNVPPSDRSIAPEHSLLLMFANQEEVEIKNGEPVHQPLGDFLDYGWGVISAMRAAPYNHAPGERVGDCIVTSVDVKDFEAGYEDRLKAYQEGFRSGITFLNQLAYKKQLATVGGEKKAELGVLRGEQNRVRWKAEQTVSQRPAHGALRRRKVTFVYDNYAQMRAAEHRIARGCPNHTVRAMSARATAEGKVALEIELKRNIKL